ncbi:hypothetical protein G6F50_014800 [Rhizopus delemar]|uniref:Uncharacterized protein n=1 Tax=Rhizopus delemar TaxID=936053 RepID=A0A9P6Y2U2_9FUNG|nr:hypothetical protein G6F50_014800 [Rhizopus delemar]
MRPLIGARGPGGTDIGLGLLLRGHGVFQVLLADRVDLGQLGDALGAQAGGVGGGFGAGQLGAGVVGLGAVAGVIELVQRLAGLDHAALGEQALGNDAVDLRAHFGHQEGIGAARQFAGQAHGLGLQRDHGDVARALFGGLGLAATGSHGRGDGQRQREGSDSAQQHDGKALRGRNLKKR